MICSLVAHLGNKSCCYPSPMRSVCEDMVVDVLVSELVS